MIQAGSDLRRQAPSAVFKAVADVSTVILAGYSGFATKDMAMDFIDDGLRIESRDVQPDRPVVRVLAARYKRVGVRRERRERVAKGRRWFGPPWSQLSAAFKD